MAIQQDGWELAGGVRVARTPHGWAYVGGWEEPDAIGFHVIVHHPDNDEMIKRQSVRVPVKVVGGEIVLGEPGLVA